MKNLIPVFLQILMLVAVPVFAASPAVPVTIKADDDKKTLNEDEKVGHLINYIRTMEGAVFIRNGKEFSPAEAASHLNSKWEKHKKRVKTAQGFVSQLATQSKNKIPYQIRLSSGQTVKCCDLLTEELKKIEGL